MVIKARGVDEGAVQLEKEFGEHPVWLADPHGDDRWFFPGKKDIEGQSVITMEEKQMRRFRCMHNEITIDRVYVRVN